MFDCRYFCQLQYPSFWFYGLLLIGAICGVIKLGPGLVDQVSIMGSLRDPRNQVLAQLKLQLAAQVVYSMKSRSAPFIGGPAVIRIRFHRSAFECDH